MSQSKHHLLETKLVGPDKLMLLVRQWKSTGKRIVFTNGCFDILHAGHVDYLSRAADHGQVLIVGLNTDHSVKRIKGPNRPLNPQQARAKLLASLFFVDAVVLFDQDTPEELIRLIGPHILVKGGDYQPDTIAGASNVIQDKGRVVTIPLLEGYSTSGLIEKIRSLK